MGRLLARSDFDQRDQVWRVERVSQDDAAGIAETLRRADANLRILGPAPAPLGRLRGEYRAQLLIKGTNRKKIREPNRKSELNLKSELLNLTSHNTESGSTSTTTRR